jgi:hypothetical protein
VIIGRAAGVVQVYNPLVVNQGAVARKDFIVPVMTMLPTDTVVGIWFGSNSPTLKLVGSTSRRVNRLGNSMFGQFVYCNSPAFFQEAAYAVYQGLLAILLLGAIGMVHQLGYLAQQLETFE